MSLEVVLRTSSVDQDGPARIVSFSRDAMGRNFTLGQSGKSLSFRLRTTETDFNGMHPSLFVPNVFDVRRVQHFVVTYDGLRVLLYVDGKLSAESIELTGGFENWGRNHLLTIRDEVPGNRPWYGTIEHFSIYDRALDAKEVAQLSRGGDVSGAVYLFKGSQAGGMRPLKHRNLFIFSDSVFILRDCFVNTAGFIPLAALVLLAFPVLQRGHKLWRYILFAVIGLAISGLIEFAQQWIASRVPCLLDLVYNVFGTLLGCLLLWLVLARRRPPFFNKESSL